MSIKPPATAQQVAQRAGVSRTTVSFVLNAVLDKGISAATRARVLAVAAELGYQPNAAARSLASGSSGTVGLVVPRAEHLHDDPFLAQLLASINTECHALGLKLLLESAEHDSATVTGFVTLARTRRIDGLIVVNPRTDQLVQLEHLTQAGIPLVVLGQPAAAVPPFAPATPSALAAVAGHPPVRSRQRAGPARYACVGQDTRIGARLAVDHLVGLGHRAIAYLGFAGPEYVAGAERAQGWRDALLAHGLTPQEALLDFGDVTAASGHRAMVRLLARAGRLTALFAGNDTMAFGALCALREAGLRVPEDVAVVGYDDIPLAAFAAPPLTTVRTDPVAHGRVAMAALAGLLGTDVGRSGSAPPPPVSLPEPLLVVRASCGARST